MLRESRELLRLGSQGGLTQVQRRIAEVADRVRRPAVVFEEAASRALHEVTAADILVTQLRQSLDGYADTDFAAHARRSLDAGFAALASVREVERGIEPVLGQIADLERLSVVLRRDLSPARRGFLFLADSARLVLGWGSADS